VKVLHLINTLSAGGAELHLLTLCRHLKKRGVETVVACLREEVRGSRSLCADFEEADIRVFNLKADSRYNVSFFTRLATLVRAERPDIVHTHLPRADIAGALVSGFCNSPVFLCSVHGIYRDRWFGHWSAPLMRRTYRRADTIVAISFAVKNWLQQDFGIPEDKIRVIHYGIEPERFVLPGQPDESAAETRGNRMVIGSIGRLEPGKGFDRLIRAMTIVHQQMPNATLMIAGHDPLGFGKSLVNLVSELGLSEHVRLVGFQRDVPAFLNGIDVFALASCTEGFGQVVIEAMAAVKPVVVSDIAPLTEIVINGETGCLAKSGDPQSFASALLSILSDRELAARMGRRGQRRVHDSFSAQRMADETLALYESLLQSSHEEVANAV
jgi:glycosyltransferase involved in cell wall biosynthesis